MKQKPQSTSKPKREVNLQTSSKNLFFNIIIFLLAAVIIFLSYSLYVKISGIQDDSVAEAGKPSDIIQMEVLNGCGVSGVADDFTDFLRNNNFDVVQMGNYISFDIDKSIIIDRSGNKANAYKVAEVLGIDKKNVIQQLNNEYFLDVSLIIGRDYAKLNPNN